MRLCTLLLFLLPLAAQEPSAPAHKERKPPMPTNLKLLQPANLMNAMQAFRLALNVKCTFCHVEGNFASDDNPHKEVALKMIVMSREINEKFPDGKMHVTCYTCHRGAEEPATAPPAEAPAAK